MRTSSELSSRVAAVRAFNRFYTRRIGLLRVGILIGMSQQQKASTQLKYESHQDKWHSSQIKGESSQIKLDSMQHKGNSFQVKGNTAADDLNPQPLPPKSSMGQ